MTDRTERMQALLEDLYPLCRSITGPGVRATLDRIGRDLPVTGRRVPSGTAVLDWTVPDEWTLREAHLTCVATGERVVDTATSNLHVVNFSRPFTGRLDLDALRPHLFSLPDRPDVVPYRTSYYNPTWGLCLSQRTLDRLAPGEYDVVIDTVVEPGHLDYAELVVPGATDTEVLLTTHVCHPSLANDNLTGIAALVELGRHLLESPGLGRPQRRYTYRLLFIPGTIGSITWLATNPDAAARVRHGLVVTGLGDPSGFTYKRSRRGDATIDRIMATLLAARAGSRVIPFSPYGYDERQFCSPGYDLAVGRLTRGVHGEYPEYHTSADDLSFVSVAQLDDAVAVLVAAVDALEANRRYRNTSPYGEPQLGRRGLYSLVGGGVDQRSVEMAYLWVLNLADGDTDLCAMAERSGLGLDVLAEAARRLHAVGLLDEPAQEPTARS
jgi:aminopeptidase-like protein